MINQTGITSASSITKAASKQTYYTIRSLVDRERVDDAYRAYAYFRWVDDVLDGVLDADSSSRYERLAFLERQRSLLERCYRGKAPSDVNVQESMLVELVQRDHEKNSGLQTYLRNMMLVMDFDARRRGKVVSRYELDNYTRWLASAVTEALHYFIGNGWLSPHDETRYLAVSGAHITHMLRDTIDDVQLGYFNIPREVLDSHRISPQDIHSPPYRAWVKSRVQTARDHFRAGRAYLRRVQCLRCRLAGFAYTARFEWLLDAIERESFYLRPQYDEQKHLAAGLQMSWVALSSMIKLRTVRSMPRQISSP